MHYRWNRLVVISMLCVAPAATLKADLFTWQTWWNGGFTDSPAESYEKCSATDASGDFYVSGQAETGSGDKWLTMRVDSSGMLVWSDVWENGRPRAMVASGMGDLFVTGVSDADCALIKYSADGTFQWRVSHSFDFAGGCYQVAVDSGGRPYVASTDGSIQVVAYDVDGTFRWRGTILSSSTPPTDLEVAGDRVFLSGTQGVGADRDFLVGAFDLDDGTLEWSSTWDGSSQADIARALAVTEKGIYVAGRSAGVTTDLAVVRFDGNGNFLAERFLDFGGFDEGLDMAALGQDLLVTGVSDGATNEDLLLGRLSADLSPLWGLAYDSGDGDNRGSALAISPDQSTIYTIGENRVTSHTAGGVFNWSTPFAPSDKVRSVVASNTGVHVAGRRHSTNGFLVAELETSGAVSWQSQEPPSQATRDDLGFGSGFEIRDAVATDTSGHLFVVANPAGLPPALLKFGPDGALLGDLAAGSTLDRRLTAVAIDAVASETAGPGPVYATGRAGDSGFLQAFDAGGSLLWERFTDFGSEENSLYLAAPLPSGGVVVAGWVELESGNNDFQEGGTSRDYLIESYDATGHRTWQSTVDLGFGEIDIPTALEVDDLGRTFITGYGGANTSEPCLTLAFDASGAELWREVMDEPADTEKRCYDLALTTDGKVVVAVGNHDFSAGGPMLIAYEAATGVEAWRTPGDPVNPLDLQEVVAIADGGVAAASYRSPTAERGGPFGDPAITIGIDDQGGERWRASTLPADEFYSLTYSTRDDLIIVSSDRADTAINADLDGTGRQIWSHTIIGNAFNTLWSSTQLGDLYRVTVARLHGPTDDTRTHPGFNPLDPPRVESQPGETDDIMVMKLEPGILFADGFESDDTLSWHLAVGE